MLILALECSTARGSAALAVGTGLDRCLVRWHEEFPAGRGHGGKLFTTLERGLTAMRKDGERLEHIVVGLGPGSYSGVRQAIATATGLALATGAKLHGRPSTAALQTNETRPYQVISDARREAFYYTAVQGGDCLAGPELLNGLAALQARVSEHPSWPVVAMEEVPPGMPPEVQAIFPHADHLLMGSPANLLPAPLEPIYLRPVSVTLPKTGP